MRATAVSERVGEWAVVGWGVQGRGGEGVGARRPAVFFLFLVFFTALTFFLLAFFPPPPPLPSVYSLVFFFPVCPHRF